MIIDIQRIWFTDQSTMGNLYVDGQPEGYTIERPQSDPEHPCIPEGEYEVLLVPPGPHLAQMFPYKLFPEVQNVPGRTGIFIHPANKASQLLGCIAPGRPYKADYVYNSRVTFESLMTLLGTATDGITIRITSTGNADTTA